MFLSRMVNGLLNPNKNTNRCSQNQPLQQEQPDNPSSNPIKTSKKPYRKPDKKTGKKPNPKKTISEYFRASVYELPQPAIAKATTSIDESTSKSLLCTKVKSGSWKRSDQSSTSFNALTNKKTKSLGRRSPNWLKFPNVPVKIAEEAINTSDKNAACRPGTLYSDVLFGAGSSSSVKVKQLTPRRSCDTAQSKLTKALFKFSPDRNNHPDSDVSEGEAERNIFPSLHKLPHVKLGNCTTTSPNVSSNSESRANSSATASFAKSDDSYEEADVVILSDRNDNQAEEDEVTYGNYLDQQFVQNGSVQMVRNTSHNTTDCRSDWQDSSSCVRPQFCIDIPQWNFTEPDVSSEGFPKFMGQFDDERYLKAEQLALLSLNLALGNNSGHSKFKF